MSMIEKKYLKGFYIFLIIIALLELGQDYIDSMLNAKGFFIIESISYKLFWPLFIPFALMMAHMILKAKINVSKSQYAVIIPILVIMASAIHLLVFSGILFGISQLIHETPWSFSYLLTEKLSNRLYIALSIYLVITSLLLYYKLKRSQKPEEKKNLPKSIRVKTGKRSAIVFFNDINWIGSDAAYLDIHTIKDKYVVMDTLKNMTNKLPENFKRVHKSTIVNVDKIKEMKSRGNGDYDLIMDDMTVLRLSRNYREQLETIFI